MNWLLSRKKWTTVIFFKVKMMHQTIFYFSWITKIENSSRLQKLKKILSAIECKFASTIHLSLLNGVKDRIGSTILEWKEQQSSQCKIFCCTFYSTWTKILMMICSKIPSYFSDMIDSLYYSASCFLFYLIKKVWSRKDNFLKNTILM